MFEKLAQIENTFEELTQQMTDPAVISDMERYTKVTKQHRELAALELAESEAGVVKAEEELKVLLLPKDPNDEKNVILEIRAGTGGEEACLFAAEILRMYARYAERQGWRLEVTDISETGLGGIQKAEAII